VSRVPRALFSPRVSAGALFAVVLVAIASSAVSAAPALQQASPTPTCVSPPQGIVLRLFNPKPLAVLAPSTSIVMNGIAYDNTATQGTGIDSVTAYLDDRNAGGLFLGKATLGQPNPEASSGAQFANAGFSITSEKMPNVNSPHTIFVYAHSTVSNKEQVLQVPVFIGSGPTAIPNQTATPVAPPLPICTPTPVPSNTPTTAPTSPPTEVPTATPPGVPTAPAAAPAATAASPVATIPPAIPPAAPVAVASPTPTAAPSGGGIPPELGVPLLLAGAATVLGGGLVRLRERRRGRGHDEAPPPD
jgi:hypothetical protein